MRKLLFALAAVTALHAADEPPAWVREAAAQAIPTYSAKVNTVELLREEAATIEADGKVVVRERGAVKIIQPGARTLRAYRNYDAKNGRIRDFQAWLLPANGKPTSFGKNRIVDIATSPNFVLYDESRAKAIDSGATEVGSIFAWEVTEEEKTLITQDQFSFQGRSPVLMSRFSVTIPAGWEARGVVFNHDAVEPKVAGNSYTWELRNLPWIEPEDYGLETNALAPRVAVSYFPPTGNASGLPGLKDWPSVSTWLTTLIDPSAEVTPAIRAKAEQLTANVPNELEKIRAIASFAQQTTYVAVALNLNRGGGYIPHKADETLTKNYGDCKDKANLMRALLKAVEIESYITVISADDRTYVRPEWASPTQFNHAIIAIRVSDAVNLPTVVPSPLGRLLVFDPTDSVTPLGDLPEDEQSSHALVIAGANGALLKMPLLPPSANRVESSVEGSMDGDGRLKARVQRQYFGQSGISLRSVEKMQGHDELKKVFEVSMARRLGGATLSRVTTDGKAEEGHFHVDLDLAAERFGQIMQGKLLIVRPGILAGGRDYYFTSKQRSSPVKLEANLRRDSIRIKVPPGFILDELPRPGKLESPYGSIEATWALRDGDIVMEQTFEIRDSLVPASDYAKLRDFFDRVGGVQRAAVVLMRNGPPQ